MGAFSDSITYSSEDLWKDDRLQIWTNAKWKEREEKRSNRNRDIWNCAHNGGNDRIIVRYITYINDKTCSVIS